MALPSDLFFIVNPQAGRYAAEDLVARIAMAAKRSGVHAAVHVLGERESIHHVALGALGRGYRALVAVGGDGTVSAVAGSAAFRDAAVGIVPTGTANMLAQELGIPLDVDGAIELAMSRPSIGRIDAMEMGGRFYVYQIVLGPGSEAVARIRREQKRLLGRSVYALAGLDLLTSYHPVKVWAAVDGREVRLWSSQIIVANAGILGLRPFRLGAGIRVDDGKMEVIIMRGRTRLSFLSSGIELFVGNFDRSRGLRYLDARRAVEISTEPATAVKADGEIVGHTPISIQVRPGAVKVIVPEDRERRGGDSNSRGVDTTGSQGRRRDPDLATSAYDGDERSE